MRHVYPVKSESYLTGAQCFMLGKSYETQKIMGVFTQKWKKYCNA